MVYGGLRRPAANSLHVFLTHAHWNVARQQLGESKLSQHKEREGLKERDSELPSCHVDPCGPDKVLVRLEGGGSQ